MPQNAEDLLCAGQCSKHWGFVTDEKEQQSLLSGSFVLVAPQRFSRCVSAREGEDWARGALHTPALFYSTAVLSL